MIKRLIPFFTASAVAIGSVPALADDEFRIGVSAPSTGKTAAYGEQMSKAARAYAAWINEKGGVLGKQISLQVEDDECDPKSAVSVANRMIAENISFVVGPLCTPAVNAARDVYRENDILAITLAQGPVSGPDYPDILRINASNYGITKGMIEQASRQHYKNIALLYQNDAYGKDIHDTLQTQAREKGITINMHSYEAEMIDFYVHIDRMKKEGVEAVLIAGYAAETTYFIRQLKERMSDMPVIFSGTGTNPDIASTYTCKGDEETNITVIAAEDGKNIQVDAVLLKKFEEVNQPFQESAYFTVAALEAWRAAVEKTGSFDNEAVRAALLKGGLKTMTGEIGFIGQGPQYGHPANEPVTAYAWRCTGPGVMTFGR